MDELLKEMAASLFNKTPRGYSARNAPDKLKPIYDALEPDQDSEYGTILPFAQNRKGSAKWVQEGDNKRVALSELPREILSGLTDLLAGTETGQVTPRAAETLMTVGIGSSGAAAPRGSVGVFGGRNSRTAPPNSGIAEDRLASGRALIGGSSSSWVNHELENQVLKDTGWFQGHDGKMKYEIDDRKAKLTPYGQRYAESGRTNFVPLPSLFDHPELFAAYPQLANDVVRFDPKRLGAAHAHAQDGISGSTFIGTNLKGESYLNSLDASRLLLHEIQHAIQHQEGFAKGGKIGNAVAQQLLARGEFRSPGQLLARDALYIDSPTFRKSLSPSRLAEAENMRASLPQSELVKLAEENVAHAGYQRLAGEVEARNVEARRLLTLNQRRRTHPHSTEEFSGRQQLINMRDY